MTVFLADPDVTLWHGEAHETLAQLPDESVHCCVTSPPFYGLRDYGTGRWEGGNADCDHTTPRSRGDDIRPGDKQGTSAGSRPNTQTACKCGARRVDQQIGLEATPDEWVASLVAVFRQVRRVLRRDGTLWLEVGDSYVSGQGGRQSGVGELPPSTRFDRKEAGKKRQGLPSSFGERDVGPRFYPTRDTGLKPKDLIGAPWMLAFALRQDGWYLRADIVWARPNPMPESVTDRPTKSHSYVFLLTKSPRYFFDQEAVREPATYYGPNGQPSPDHPRGGEFKGRAGVKVDEIPGRNVRSVWNIATQPYPEAHFATFPEALARRCILAGCPEGGTVLDPFCGSGTVAKVCRDHARHSIGIDLNATYLELAAKRLQQLSLLA